MQEAHNTNTTSSTDTRHKIIFHLDHMQISSIYDNPCNRQQVIKVTMKDLNTSSTCLDNKRDKLIVDFPEGPRNRHKISGSRKVAFSPTSTLHQYRICYGDDDDQVDDCRTRYKKADYKAFRQQLKTEVALARMLKKELDCNDSCIIGDYKICRKDYEIFCTGIEHLLCPKTLTTKEEHKELHRYCVLQEYARQVDEGVQNPIALCLVSKLHSMKGQAMS